MLGAFLFVGRRPRFPRRVLLPIYFTPE